MVYTDPELCKCQSRCGRGMFIATHCAYVSRELALDVVPRQISRPSDATPSHALFHKNKRPDSVVPTPRRFDGCRQACKTWEDMIARRIVRRHTGPKGAKNYVAWRMFTKSHSRISKKNSSLNCDQSPKKHQPHPAPLNRHRCRVHPIPLPQFPPLPLRQPPKIPRQRIEDIPLCRHNRILPLRPSNLDLLICLIKIPIPPHHHC